MSLFVFASVCGCVVIGSETPIWQPITDEQQAKHEAPDRRTHRQTEREREEEEGSTRSLNYCNHAEIWIRERPIRWGTLAPDKTTPVSFCPCRIYEAVLACDSNMPNVHSTQLPSQSMPRKRLRSLPGQPVTYAHIRWHTFGVRCRPLTFTIRSCMAKVKV